MSSDAFISYNRADEKFVERVAKALRQRNIAVYYDQWELRPGTDWQPALEKELAATKCVLAFVGSKGPGSWQSSELQVALDEQKERGCPVVPVLVPGYDESDKLPRFLRTKTWVDMRKGLGDDALGALLFGITGERPWQEDDAAGAPAATTTAALDESQQSIARLVEILDFDRVTFFVGQRASIAKGTEPQPQFEISKKLLEELSLIKHDYDALMPGVDMASVYYALKKGERSLEYAYTEMILEKAEAAVGFDGDVQDELIRLMAVLSKQKMRRGRQRVRQVIITTSLDLALERALLSAGLPFTRLVQHRLEPVVEIGEYREVARLDDGSIQLTTRDGPQKCKPGDLEALDKLISRHPHRCVQLGASVRGRSGDRDDTLAFEELPEPIVYKFFGSYDVKNTCAISTDQQLGLAAVLLSHRSIPSGLMDVLSNSPIVFVGTGMLDPDFRIACHTLLKDSLTTTTDLNLIVQPRPDQVSHRVEPALWEEIKRNGQIRLGLSVIEQDAGAFLVTLRQAVEARLADQ